VAKPFAQARELRFQPSLSGAGLPAALPRVPPTPGPSPQRLDLEFAGEVGGELQAVLQPPGSAELWHGIYLRAIGNKLRPKNSQKQPHCK
jgi:hypothetical protein